MRLQEANAPKPIATKNKKERRIDVYTLDSSTRHLWIYLMLVDIGFDNWQLECFYQGWLNNI